MSLQSQQFPINREPSQTFPSKENFTWQILSVPQFAMRWAFSIFCLFLWKLCGCYRTESKLRSLCLLHPIEQQFFKGYRRARTADTCDVTREIFFMKLHKILLKEKNQFLIVRRQLAIWETAWTSQSFLLCNRNSSECESERHGISQSIRQICFRLINYAVITLSV